jgi:signal transduction histidine kinase
MTGQGSLGRSPNRRISALVAVLGVWMSAVIALVIWWERLVLKQAERIDLLERRLGEVAGVAGMGGSLDLERTQRMVAWEASSFLLLIVAVTGLLAWLYWRDLRRTRQIQAFFAGVTHELKTPLSSVRLQAESIAEKAGGDPGNQVLVRRLLEDTLRLEAQVERTLELARVEGGGTMYPRPLRLKPWVERSVQSWREACGDRVTFEARVDDVSVQADPAALQVVLRNLIENAIRHSGREQVRVVVEGGGLLRVRDDGAGYPGAAADLGRIFHKGPASQGAGVGLYLVRVLMERMGGEAEFAGVQPSGFETRLKFREVSSDVA